MIIYMVVIKFKEVCLGIAQFYLEFPRSPLVNAFEQVIDGSGVGNKGHHAEKCCQKVFHIEVVFVGL